MLIRETLPGHLRRTAGGAREARGRQWEGHERARPENDRCQGINGRGELVHSKEEPVTSLL